MFWKVLLGIWMSLVIVGSFLYAPPALGLGEVSRIIYYHVPLAWAAVLAYLVSMINAFKYLRTSAVEYDHRASFNAEMGTVFALLATVTGALFAKATWGAYWNWDPRQTSIFVLLLIYGSYFALRSAIDEEGLRARLSSVYAIIAFITVPFLVFIIPRVYATLHPDPIINVGGRLKMDSRMLQVFLSSLLGFTGLYFWIYNLQNRIISLKEKLKRRRYNV
ncbi:MAG: cytochrome C biogenesis protein [Firmicutes bacterium HGW-Firmicutes-13]|nr:MAG: cytochrome C biogenesis protein [Firmicutes bacterium HGW-Firmicutes-13]